MNAVVTGGRDYVLTQADYQFLEHAMQMLRVKEIYTDGTPGVATQVGRWATRRGIPVGRVTANFMHDGPATPAERNTTLTGLAQAVIAFPGGTATDDMVEQARRQKLQVFESPGRQLANLPTMDMRLRHLHAGPHHRSRISP